MGKYFILILMLIPSSSYAVSCPALPQGFLCNLVGDFSFIDLLLGYAALILVLIPISVFLHGAYQLITYFYPTFFMNATQRRRYQYQLDRAWAYVESDNKRQYYSNLRRRRRLRKLG
ncbi:hypothetical protein BegalDRAFT_1470 [Beggiatoa alba B18LD]|uniref:Uncharacterized protein n=1 Tax=Beggiatoa alba B18LD TaxID=395493 RepID=I3CFG5_9GAMM|nr:hypothetical protein [Beggiatoa alba]EIJ42358.1 hypothetical protein BegalDRAFT_1470 [Beggiatoa alba B18LD]